MSAQQNTSTGRFSLPMYERMISMQWQPRSTIAPPPACDASQNHALCGPGCVSRERAHMTWPICPACTALTALSVFGV